MGTGRTRDARTGTEREDKEEVRIFPERSEGQIKRVYRAGLTSRFYACLVYTDIQKSGAVHVLYGENVAQERRGWVGFL